MRLVMTHWSYAAILSCFFILPLVYAAVGDRHGTMLFLRAGSSVEIGALFTTSSYNDHVTTFKHLWNISDLMNGTTDYFRSPLMDRMSELEMTNFDVIAYNAAGEVMTSFPLEIAGDDMMSSKGVFAFLGGGFMLKSAVTENKMNVLVTKINTTEPRGTQFILTSDDNFHDLPEPVSMGCYKFPSTFLFDGDSVTWSVDSASECLILCTALNGYHYAVVFHSGTSTTPTDFQCLCEISISMAVSTDDTATQCPDKSDCGCVASISGVSYIYPSVYSIATMNTFLAGLLNDTYASKYFQLAIVEPYANLAEQTIIKSISFENDPTFEYELGFSQGDTCGPNEDFTYYGTGRGAIEIFNASLTETIVGTPASCLKLKFRQTPPTSHVGLKIITQTDTFVKADYLRLVGHWKNSECVSRKRFFSSSLIPDVWVNIVQMNSPIANNDYQNVVYFPESSAAVVHIRLPAEINDFYVLQTIELTANVEVQINTKINTNGTCILIGYGNKFQQLYKGDFTHVINSTHGSSLLVPQICARNISFVVNTTHPTGALTPLVNKMTFVLRGCVLYDFYLSAACDNEDITGDILMESSASWTWVPHVVRTVTYLRPGGPGLVLYRYADPYIVIRLDDKWVDIEVTRVLITGDIMRANVTIGGVRQTLYNETDTRLDYNPGGLSGHDIRIDNIQGNFNTQDYIIMHLYFEICVPDFTANRLTSSTEIPNTSSSGSATSPQPITSANPATVTSQGSSTSPLGSTLTPSGPSTAQTTLAHVSIPTSLTNSPQSTTQNSPVSTNTAAASSQGSITTPLVSASTLFSTSTAQTTLTDDSTATPHTTSPTTVTSNSPASSNPQTVSTQGPNTSPLVSTLTPPVPSTAQTTVTHATTATPLATSQQPITSTTAASATSSDKQSTLAPGTSTSKPITSTSSPQATTVKSTTSGPVSTTPLSASTTATTTSPSHTRNHSTGTTQPPPPCCVCFGNTVNMSVAEVEVIVAEIVQNLTVPKQTTSAFKRRLISAPDQRTSAKMVGTVGIVMMTLTGAAIVAMDYSSIVALLKFIKHLFV